MSARSRFPASGDFACARLSVDPLAAVPSTVMAAPCDGALPDRNREASLAPVSLSRAVTSRARDSVSLTVVGREPELDRLPSQDFSDRLRHQPRPMQPRRPGCGPSRSRQAHGPFSSMTMTSSPRTGRWAALRSTHISKPKPGEWRLGRRVTRRTDQCGMRARR